MFRNKITKINHKSETLGILPEFIDFLKTKIWKHFGHKGKRSHSLNIHIYEIWRIDAMNLYLDLKKKNPSLLEV